MKVSGRQQGNALLHDALDDVAFSYCAPHQSVRRRGAGGLLNTTSGWDSWLVYAIGGKCSPARRIGVYMYDSLSVGSLELLAMGAEDNWTDNCWANNAGQMP